MASVYAVLYDKSGTFLMARKRCKSYYTQADGGLVNALGWTIRSGPGKYALPGGTLELEDATSEAGARREFFEETGFHLPDSLNPPETVKFGKDGVPNARRIAFSAVYFFASEEDVEKTWSNISKIALPNSKKIVGAIRRGEIQEYSEITEYEGKHGEWPADNELEWVWRWSFENNRAQIESMKNDASTDWYYWILEYLYGHILNRKV